ncbi:MAG TPA: class F sortase [Roseiflexaceae bacterium]|nr:class F sortase [Roseiflexaceae bacterium]
MNHRWRRVIALLALSCLLVPAGAAHAQAGGRCFRETGYCIAGPIRDFWERNGGLMVFGFPITPQQPERVEGRPTQVQWFERSRLELHPENPAPYDVQIGRMGADRLSQLRRNWKTFPQAAPGAGCRTFAETGHSVCGELLTAWQSSGLNLDGDPSINDSESLGLFGLPLSSPTPEQGGDGNTYIVQWFERARFELHPENAPPYNVLLGLLGRELSPRASAPPAPIQASAPTRLVIDAIGLDYQTVGVGIDARGELVVPDHDVAWYTASAAPGQGNNVVFWAHVLRFAYAPNIPAPFARLKELPIGARVTVYDDVGNAHAYAVTQQIQATPDQVEYILPSGREQITMVSCYGSSVIVDGSVVDMSHRLITIAEPI